MNSDFDFSSQSQHLSYLVIGAHQTLLPPPSLCPLQQLLETENVGEKRNEEQIGQSNENPARSR